MLKGSRQRLNKTEYLKMRVREGLQIKETPSDNHWDRPLKLPSHKKKSKDVKRFLSDISLESNDKFIVCGNCRDPLMEKKKDERGKTCLYEDEINPYEENIGKSNCCYDCEFCWFCKNCCFNFFSLSFYLSIILN